MDDKAKCVRRLEKDNSTLKQKYEQLNANILKMAEEHSITTRALAGEKKARMKLEGLCRALQAERKRLDERISAYELEDDEEDEDYSGEEECSSDEQGGDDDECLFDAMQMDITNNKIQV